MYPVKQNKNKIKITLFDLIDDFFAFILLCVRSMSSPKSLSCFLEKNLHI